MTDLTAHADDTLRRDGEFVLYRGRHSGPNGLGPAFLLTPASTHPSAATIGKLAHEHSLAAELDPAWAVRPLALVELHERATLVLDDPGGEPLDRLLNGPLEPALFLAIAVGLAHALAALHARGLIHKDVKP